MTCFSVDNIKDLEVILEQHIEQVKNSPLFSVFSVLPARSSVLMFLFFVFYSPVWNGDVRMRPAGHLSCSFPIHWKVDANPLWLFKTRHSEELALNWIVFLLINNFFYLVRVREDMDMHTTPLIGAHGYCTQVWTIYLSLITSSQIYRVSTKSGFEYFPGLVQYKIEENERQKIFLAIPSKCCCSLSISSFPALQSFFLLLPSVHPSSMFVFFFLPPPTFRSWWICCSVAERFLTSSTTM